MSEKVRENRLRRWAARLGLSLRKSRARNWNIDNYQRFMIVDPSINTILAGQKYDMDLDAVEKYLKEEEADKKSKS